MSGAGALARKAARARVGVKPPPMGAVGKGEARGFRFGSKLTYAAIR